MSAPETGFTREEVRLALRNPGMPLEGLRHATTPVGMHYVLVHFDITRLFDIFRSESFKAA